MVTTTWRKFELSYVGSFNQGVPGREQWQAKRPFEPTSAIASTAPTPKPMDHRPSTVILGSSLFSVEWLAASSVRSDMFIARHGPHTPLRRLGRPD